MADGVLLAEVVVLVEFPGRPDRETLSQAAEAARLKLTRHFEYRGIGDHVRIEVEVTPGSLKGSYKVTLVALGALFIQYGSIRQSMDYLVADAAYVVDLGYRLADYVARPEQVTLTRHDGPLLTINAVLERYDAKLVDRATAIATIEEQLALINDSDDREAMVLAIVELMDHRNPLFWRGPPPPSAPPPSPDPSGDADTPRRPTPPKRPPSEDGKKKKKPR